MNSKSTELELWRAHEGLSVAAEHSRRIREARPWTIPSYAAMVDRSYRHDPTPVPYRLREKLVRESERRGFPVRWVSQAFMDRMSPDDKGGSVAGMTRLPIPPDMQWMADLSGADQKLPPVGMYVVGDMSEASTVHVVAHELGHVLSEVNRYGINKNERLFCLEELHAESAAALVCGALKCSDGRFAVHYLSNHSPAEAERIRPLAVRTADEILAAVA